MSEETPPRLCAKCKSAIPPKTERKDCYCKTCRSVVMRDWYGKHGRSALKRVKALA